jgi:L-threonylcarbamoyladenylate synthase
VKEDFKKALEVLRSGGVILYPTDTVWGLGCDATDMNAVEKLYRIKKRDRDRSMLILVDHPNRIERYVENMPEIAWNIIELSHKPLTIIFPGAMYLAENLVASDGSIGIRVVGDEFCRELISRLKKPLVSTSANKSGQPAPASFTDIDSVIIDSVDYVVQWRQDETRKTSPSGIIKLGPKGEIKVIRE